MKVLFVSSGNKSNKKGKPGTVVYNQGESLKKAGLEVSYFLIEGKGFFGYFKNIRKITSFVNNTSFDIIHAHYSLTAFATTIALLFNKKMPIIVSLMGSDTKGSIWVRWLVHFCSWFFWSKIIVKSQSMKKDIGLKNSIVLPNGVDVGKIEAIEHKISKSNLEAKHSFGRVLFPADPSRESKNYPLAKKAMEIVNARLKVIYNKPHVEILESVLKTDVLLLTSRWEGSPNIIKEAMACNKPVVATDVGDIRWLFGDEPGYFITSFEPADVAAKINKALQFGKDKGRTNGRQRILDLELDAESVAKRIIGIYKKIVKSEE